jgi:hypothetical protein
MHPCRRAQPSAPPSCWHGWKGGGADGPGPVPSSSFAGAWHPPSLGLLRGPHPVELAEPMSLVRDEFAVDVAAEALLCERARRQGGRILREMCPIGAVIERGGATASATGCPFGLEDVDLSRPLLGGKGLTTGRGWRPGACRDQWGGAESSGSPADTATRAEDEPKLRPPVAARSCSRRKHRRCSVRQAKNASLVCGGQE